jgi:hypothetical protein
MSAVVSVPRRLPLAVLAAAFLGLADPAGAEPQANAGLTVGGAAVGPEGRFWDHAEVLLGLHGDVLLGRSRAEDFGLGPFLEVGTLAFDELDLAAGATALLPVHDTFPLLVSAGLAGRIGDDGLGFEPGVSAEVFWGTRSYNYHASYVMSAGLLVGFRQSLGPSREAALLVAAHLDLAVLGLPLAALVNWLRGPTGAAGPVPE